MPIVVAIVVSTSSEVREVGGPNPYYVGWTAALVPLTRSPPDRDGGERRVVDRSLSTIGVAPASPNALDSVRWRMDRGRVGCHPGRLARFRPDPR